MKMCCKCGKLKDNSHFLLLRRTCDECISPRTINKIINGQKQESLKTILENAAVIINPHKETELLNKDMKKCSWCGEIKPKTEFHKSNKEKDGLVSQCKSCRNKKQQIKDIIKREYKILADNETEENAEIDNQEIHDVKKILFPKNTIPKRKYYLHTRKGIYYAELINQITGIRMSARSTGKNTKEEALEVIDNWLKNGVPKERINNKANIEHECTVDAIIFAILRTKLTKEDTARIAAYLTKKYITFDLEYLIEKVAGLKEIYEKEKDNYRTLKHNSGAYYSRYNKINPSVSDEILANKLKELKRRKMQLLYLERRIKKIKRGERNGQKTDECR